VLNDKNLTSKKIQNREIPEISINPKIRLNESDITKTKLVLIPRQAGFAKINLLHEEEVPQPVAYFATGWGDSESNSAKPKEARSASRVKSTGLWPGELGKVTKGASAPDLVKPPSEKESFNTLIQKHITGWRK